MASAKTGGSIRSLVLKIQELSIELSGKEIIRQYLLESRNDERKSLDKINTEMKFIAEDIIKRTVILKNSLNV